jgi:hypothetical protein
MVYQLAQINAAPLLFPIDDPKIVDFVNNLVRINALAEQSEGFVWRLVGEGNDATDIRLSDDPNLLVNISVWENVESLYKFTHNTAHIDFFKRRREWFTKWSRPSPVLWWIPEGEYPTLADVHERIDYMEIYGATPYAFNFKVRYTIAEMLEYSANKTT